MNFSFIEEQQLLDITRQLLDKDGTSDARRQIAAAADSGCGTLVWRNFSELGLLSLQVPEADGGLGGNVFDTLLVMQAIGENAVRVPYLGSAVMATAAIAALGNEHQRARWLPQLAAGERIAVMAHDETGSRDDWRAITTSATMTANGYLLHGRKSVVADAPTADLLLVSARLGNADVPDRPIGLFLVPRGSARLEQHTYQLPDGTQAADLVFDGVTLGRDALLDAVLDAQPRIEAVRALGAAALCAEAVGLLDRLATLIAGQQKPRILPPATDDEVTMHLDQARAACYAATAVCLTGDQAARHRQLSAAHAVIERTHRLLVNRASRLPSDATSLDDLTVHCLQRVEVVLRRLGHDRHAHPDRMADVPGLAY